MIGKKKGERRFVIPVTEKIRVPVHTRLDDGGEGSERGYIDPLFNNADEIASEN